MYHFRPLIRRKSLWLLTMSGKSRDRAIRIRDPHSHGRKTIAGRDVEEAIVVRSIGEEETQGTGVNEEIVTSPVALIAGSEEEADSTQGATATAVETQKVQSLHLATKSR